MRRVQRMGDVEEYNVKLKNTFMADMTTENLERYVLSELLSPIEDYENALKIIHEYKDTYASTDLLIVGANEANYWYVYDYDFLDCLISKYDKLERKQQAIVNFLIADNIRRNDADYKENTLYKNNLLKSIELSNDFAFANNRIYLADLEKSWNDDRVCREIISNIKEFFTEDTHRNEPISYFTDISHYIDEYVLGIVTFGTAEELISTHRMFR